MRAYERLLKYVKVWTTSDPESGTHPSTMRQFDLAHQFVDGADAELGHVLPQLLRHEGQIVDDVFGLAPEVLAQFGVLGADAHGAGVQVASTSSQALLSSFKNFTSGT